MIFHENKECCYSKFVPWCFIPNFTIYSEAEVTKSKTSKIHAFTWTEKWKIHVVTLKVLFTMTYVSTIHIIFLFISLYNFSSWLCSWICVGTNFTAWLTKGILIKKSRKCTVSELWSNMPCLFIFYTLLTEFLSFWFQIQKPGAAKFDAKILPVPPFTGKMFWMSKY